MRQLNGASDFSSTTDLVHDVALCGSLFMINKGMLLYAAISSRLLYSNKK